MLTGLIFTQLILLTSAQAKEVDLAPAWSQSPYFVETKTHAQPDGLGSAFDVVGADAKFRNSKQLEYTSLVRDYEMRERYGLLTQNERAAHQARMAKYSRSTVEGLGDIFVRQNTERAKENTQNDPNARMIAKPLVFAAGAYFVLYRGKTLHFRLSDSTQLSARTVVPERKGQIEIQNHILNGSVEAQSKGDSERLRTGVSKKLPVVEINSALAYGMSTRTVTASLSKQLTEHVTGVVDSNRGLATGTSEETARVLFGVNF